MLITPRSLAGASAESVTGRGTGVDNAGLCAKCEIVCAARTRATAAIATASDVPPAGEGSGGGCARRRGMLAKWLLTQLGGFELAAMAGLMLAAAEVGSVTCLRCDRI